jgi:trehalose/maltose hydrolase-like predicted phosphorylase
MKLDNNVNATADGWAIFEEEFVPDQLVTTGSNYMIGNGYLGYRGTFADDRRDQYVGCVLSDTYDNADGRWKELVTVPNGLYTELTVDGAPLRWRDGGWDRYRRELSVRHGEWKAEAEWRKRGISVVERRFAAYRDPHLLVSRMEITARKGLALGIRSGIDGDVWSLNGNHFIASEGAEAGDDLEIAAVTGESGYDIVVRQRSHLTFSDGMDVGSRLIERDGPRILRTLDLVLEKGQTIVLTTYCAIHATNDHRRGPNPFTNVAIPEALPAGGDIGIEPGTRTVRMPESADERRQLLARLDPDRPSLEVVQAAATASLARATEAGWDALLAEQHQEWERRWEDMDIAVGGDPTAQILLRYNIYHNIIATPAHTDHLPIGARGLSCQAYQGAAFWDQEIFNLPMFLFSAPEIARSILIYRYRTLDGARRKARELGYDGAYYAWISGDSGEEICPSFFFKDVLSGRAIRTHFNDWQIHVSPDISYTIWKYVTVTHDWEYIRSYGAEILFEVARFLTSRVHYRVDRERYEIARVLGPDEYHENVDNNFFTNFQARFALRYAGEVYARLTEDTDEGGRAALDRLMEKIRLRPEEAKRWRDVAEGLYVPEPTESGVIPQFDGFFRLEDTTPEEIRARLLDPGEYWGWPNGIAVHTQVSKQADVAQIFVLHPQAYPREVMRANWEYYEPRTQHGSSLSPAVYAIVAAWVGHMEDAQRYFMKSCTVDLYNDNKAVSGGTFIGGIHTAACGISWQIVVLGFAGLFLTADGFGFGPHLPEGWNRLSFVVKRWGARLTVTITPAEVTVENFAAATRSISVTVGAATEAVGPGERRAIPYRP